MAPILTWIANLGSAAGEAVSIDQTSLGVTRITYTRTRQYVAYTAPVFVPTAVSTITDAEKAIAATPIVPAWIPRRIPIRVEPRQLTETPRLHEMTTWYRPASEPVRGRPRLNHLFLDASVSIPWVTIQSPILLPQWFRPASEPVRRAPQWMHLFPWVAAQEVAPPVPRLETWGVYQQNPIQPPLTIRHIWQETLPAIFPILPPPPPPPDLSTWWQPTPAFVLGRTPTYLFGPSFFWYSETGVDATPTTTVFGKPTLTDNVWIIDLLT